MELSILIPARNEQFLARTIEDILANIEGDTEVIAVLDGYWSDPPIADHPRVHLIYHPVSIGQRVATNEAARMSTARFVMKCDAHCAFDKGFDVKLMADCERDWTVVPQMRNLHVFDWQCKQCGDRTYMGPYPTECRRCDNTTDFEMVMVWKPRDGTRNNFMRFDSNLHFQYWREFKSRPQAQGDIADTMSLIGAAWLMHRERFWELGGLDEAHGSWGQMGTEIACKSWLSGGRLAVNKKTWFAHMFRTRQDFGFPYPISGADQDRAARYSQWLWRLDEPNALPRWPGAIHPLSWLIEKFAPAPDWPTPAEPKPKHPSKGLVYYTDNRLDDRIAAAVRGQIKRSINGRQLVSVGLEPMAFGRNIRLDGKRGILTMFRQILAGLEASTADIVFLVEHDVLYHPSHFEFAPPRDDTFYYNQNTWKVDAATGRALFYCCNQTLGLCAYRSLLLEHYRKRIERVEHEGFTMRMGFEPGTHRTPRGIDDHPAESWMSAYPNIDIRHGKNLTPSRWRQDQFRNQKYCQGWTEADGVPGWGVTLGRFGEFLSEVERGQSQVQDLPVV